MGTSVHNLLTVLIPLPVGSLHLYCITEPYGFGKCTFLCRDFSRILDKRLSSARNHTHLPINGNKVLWMLNLHEPTYSLYSIYLLICRQIKYNFSLHIQYMNAFKYETKPNAHKSERLIWSMMQWLLIYLFEWKKNTIFSLEECFVQFCG